MAQKTSKQNLFVTFLLFLGIYGGFLLGVRSVNGLAFYDWDNTELIRRIEIQPKHVSSLHCFWNVHLCDVLWELLSARDPSDHACLPSLGFCYHRGWESGLLPFENSGAARVGQ